MRVTCKLLCGTAVLLAAVTAGSAADLGVRSGPVQPMFQPTYATTSTWTGFYVGVNGGFGGDRFEYPATIGGTAASADVTSSGGFGGGQIGYNWQLGSWLLGFETDIQGSGIEGKVDLSAPGVASASVSSKLDYFGTVRGRLGWVATPSLLLYGTGGFAYGRTTSSVSATGLGFAASGEVHNNRTGWTAGAGAEYAITPALSLKTEYLYMDLGTENVVNTTVLGFPTTIDEKATFHTIKAGLNYRFGAF
jgi:outer membrane immunogenic protein